MVRHARVLILIFHCNNINCNLIISYLMACTDALKNNSKQKMIKIASSFHNKS